MHKIVKLHDKIIIENCLFISKSIKFDLPSIFNHWFSFSSDSHRYETSCCLKKCLNFNIKSTKKYGRKALINSVISHHGMIFKNIFHLVKCYLMFPFLNSNHYQQNICQRLTIPLKKFNIYMQFLSSLNVTLISLPCSYITSNEGNCNLCY